MHVWMECAFARRRFVTHSSVFRQGEKGWPYNILLLYTVASYSKFEILYLT